MERFPLVSFIIVARNAEHCLPELLADAAAQEYPPEKLEILLVDSASTDATPRLMEGFRTAHPQRPVLLLRNPGRLLARGWNAALAASAGSVIVRVDAHSRIPRDFVRKNAEALEGRDIAGGARLVVEPENPWQKLLCLAERSRFGSGVARYRRRCGPGCVDTLAHAAYRREVFATAGGLDERLERNQDNELHFRIRRAGYKFFFSPGIVSWHRARPTLAAFLAQKYGNGFWIGQTLGVQPFCFRARHFAPLAFVLAFAFTLHEALHGRARPFKALAAAYLGSWGVVAFEAMKGSVPNVRA
ncbi:MAG: glycosyltransferase family 2 protein, partial [Endomicrobiales bacterium]